MIRALIAARYALLLAVVAAFVGLIALGKHVTYEQSLESFFPGDDPAVIEYKKASKAFGNDNIIFVSYDDKDLLTVAGLDRVRELAGAVGPKRIGAVVDVQSLDRMPLFWQADDRLLDLMKLPGFARTRAVRAAKAMMAGLDLTVGSAMKAATSEGTRDALRAKVVAHPLLQGTVVSSDGRSTALVVRLKGMGEQDPKQTVSELREAADAFAARHGLRRPALVGPPVLLADGFTAIERDGRRLAAAGMALIGLVMLGVTWSLWWAVVPILAGWTVWLAAETILATLGLKLSLSGGPLVAQIIVLTMPAASHLAIHFRDDLRQERDRRVAAISAMRAVTRPILWCALTGAVGYAALLTSNVMPVFQFGAILAVCTLLASLLTLAISPAAMLPPFPLEIPVRYGSTSWVATRLNELTHGVVRRPWLFVVVVVAVVVPMAAGMIRLKYESNYINAFDPSARVVQDYHATEDRLGGIGLISLVVPAPREMNSASLARFAELDRDLAGVRRDGRPAITRTISLATVLDPDGRLLKLSKDRADEAVAIKLDLISASPQASFLNSFWNRDEGLSRVLVRISEQQEAVAKKRTFREALGLARSRFGPESSVTGLSFLLNRTTEGVIATQWNTIGWSVGSILLMLTLAFRGPGLAALAILPTILAVALVLGLMVIGARRHRDGRWSEASRWGFRWTTRSIASCNIAGTSAYRQLRESLFASYAVTGPGVLLSSVAVAVGFAVLRFSEFRPFSNFGAMVAIATLGSSLGNLILLPACLVIGDRLRSRRALRPEPVAVD